MAGYYLHSFDWDAVEQELANPKENLVNHLLEMTTNQEMEQLNPKGKEPFVCIQEIMKSEDWFSNRDYYEMVEIERLLGRVIDYWMRPDTKSKKMNVKFMSNVYDLIVSDAIEYVKTHSESENNELLDGLGDFHLSPIRFPYWKDYITSLQDYSPFTPESLSDPRYIPEYAIHPPEAVSRFLKVFEQAAPLFEISKAEKTKKNKAVKEKKELQQAYEEELMSPLRELVKQNLALYVTWDC